MNQFLAVRATVIVSTLAPILGVAAWLWDSGTGVQQQYAGQQERAVKALSSEQIAGLKAGIGLGYAKSAELNGWPGPLHVLELADKLSLTNKQKARMEALRQQMLAKAKPLGEQMIAAEMALDAVFSSKSPDAEDVEAATMQIASVEARLRAVHLTTHLLSAPVLSAEQKEIYEQARGYGSGQNHLSH